MEFKTELKYLDRKKKIIFVITGNGTGINQKIVLKSLSSKYDGKERILYFPKAPIKQRKVGLSIFESIFDPVNPLTAKFSEFLVMIDKEHIKTDYSKEIQEKFRREIRSFKIERESCEISKNSMKLVGKFGSKRIKVYIAITGIRFCLEEEIAKLIEEKYSEKIDGRDCGEFKRIIGKFKDIGELIENSSKKNLENIFIGITNVLKMLEE